MYLMGSSRGKELISEKSFETSLESHLLEVLTLKEPGIKTSKISTGKPRVAPLSLLRKRLKDSKLKTMNGQPQS